MKTTELLTDPNIDLIIGFIMKKDLHDIKNFHPSSSIKDALTLFFNLNYSELSIQNENYDDDKKQLFYVKYLESGGCNEDLKLAICTAFLNENIYMVKKLMSEGLQPVLEYYSLPINYEHRTSFVSQEEQLFLFQKKNLLTYNENSKLKAIGELTQKELLSFIRYIYVVPDNFDPYINEFDRATLFLNPIFINIEFDFKCQEWYTSAKFIDVESRCLYDKNLEFLRSAYFQTTKLKSIQHKNVISAILSIMILQNTPFLEKNIDISLIQ